MKDIVSKLFLAVLVLSHVGCDKDQCSNRNKVTGRYAVQDSVLIPISQEWHQQTYVLEVITCDNNPEWMELSNLSNEGFQVVVNKSNCTFMVQGEPSNDGAWESVECSGTLSENSIEFEYALTNELGEPFVGRGRGVKE